MPLRLAHRPYSLPFRTPVNTAHGTWAVREGILLRVEDEAGCSGLGEVAPIPWFGTCTVDEAREYLASLGDVFEPTLLDSIPPGLACVRGALASALAGAARAACIREGTTSPGDFDPARAHAQVAALLPAGRAALARARERAELGFRCLKWKVGVGDPADEMALLEDLLAVLPSGSRLRLDPNGAWDRRVACRWLERCAGLPVEFVEQPVAPDSRGAVDTLLGLASDFPTPLALDESVVADADIETWLERGWRGLFVLKTSLLADPEARLARLHAAGAGVVFSSALETRVGARRLFELALTWRGEARALGTGVWPLFGDPRMEGPVAAPFVTADDISKLNTEDTWNALN